MAVKQHPSGIEFRVGKNDHKVSEDFIGKESTDGLAGLQLDARWVAIPGQRALAEAAADLSIPVWVDPLTERLTTPGFNARLSYSSALLDPVHLGGHPRDQVALVDEVTGHQVPAATGVTPPHFYVQDDGSLALNQSLAGYALQGHGADHRVRAVVAVSNRYLTKPGNAARLADGYLAAGVGELELRISPMGGEDEGPNKIRSVLTALGVINAAGLHQITLGCSGTIGYVATALGLTTGYTTGIGMIERYNYAQAINGQRPKPAGTATTFVPPRAGVYLTEAALTVPRSTAAALYSSTARSRLMCRQGACAKSFDGPQQDPRRHYLHARTTQADDLLSRPAAWRSMHARDHLTRAAEFRHFLANHYPEDVKPPVNRTLGSLTHELDRRLEHRRSA